MGDEEWVARLKTFAGTGVWPSEAGNRPAPRQKKWHELYQKASIKHIINQGSAITINNAVSKLSYWNFLQVEKCPAQLKQQTSIFGGRQSCVCGYHCVKTTSEHTSTVPCTSRQPVCSSPSLPTLIVSQRQIFKPSRFGGKHVAAAKPVLSQARPPTKDHATDTTTAGPPAFTSPAVARATSTALQQSCSPKTYIQTTSPFSLPPSLSTSARRKPSTLSMSSVSTVSSESITTSCASDDCPSVETTLSSLPSVVPAVPPVSQTPSQSPALSSSDFNDFWLPAEMKKNIPLQDQKWIASTLWGNQRLRSGLKLWYEPPTPALIYHQVPTPDPFFTHRLLVWMPYQTAASS
ncbi:hypothetical protein AMEX_G18412 [Astyanax mexicanus]|uniref:DUF6729 domain-containing protein n=1 Tax=Astyanax mexicanus TaxID=7994 RepID=A0A8T2L8F5_ASTMX|nr:hypothetical protein AMEX_G18412 [Astyanax mexicanus]